MGYCVLVVVLLAGLCGSCLAQEESCSDYCSATYPQHTYPDTEDHTACARGCRLAVMDALISWPFPPEHSFCLNTCGDGYSSGSSHLYACQTGCNATTIDQKVPNRDHIYHMATIVNATDMGFVMELFEAVSSQLPQLPSFGGKLEELTQHAESMSQLLPEGGRVSTIIVIEGDEDSVAVHYGHSIINGAPSSEFHGVLPDGVGEGEALYDQDTSNYRLSCPWNYSAAGRLVTVVGVGLVVVAIVSCCFSGLLSEEESSRQVGSKKSEQLQVCVREREVFVSPQLKTPVTFSPGYPQPLPYYSEKKNTQF